LIVTLIHAIEIWRAILYAIVLFFKSQSNTAFVVLVVDLSICALVTKGMIAVLATFWAIKSTGARSIAKSEINTTFTLTI